MWDSEQWRTRFDYGATHARIYIRENRTTIAKNDPRSEAAKWAVDTESAKADLYDILARATDSKNSLHQTAITLRQDGPSRIPTIFDGKRYREAWKRECDLIINEITTIIETTE